MAPRSLSDRFLGSPQLDRVPRGRSAGRTSRSDSPPRRPEHRRPTTRSCANDRVEVTYSEVDAPAASPDDGALGGIRPEGRDDGRAFTLGPHRCPVGGGNRCIPSSAARTTRPARQGPSPWRRSPPMPTTRSISGHPRTFAKGESRYRLSSMDACVGALGITRVSDRDDDSCRLGSPQP